MTARSDNGVPASEAGTPFRKLIRSIIGIIDRLSLMAGVLSAVLLAGITLLMGGEIVSKSVFGTSLMVSWEFSAYMMASIFFLGSPYALRSGTHVRVELFQAALPPRVRRSINQAVLVCGMFLVGFMTFALADFSLNSYSRGLMSFTPARTPLFVPQTAIALGAALLFLQMGAELLRSLMGEIIADCRADQRSPT